MFLNIFFVHLIDCLVGCGAVVATDYDLPDGTPIPKPPLGGRLDYFLHPGKRRSP
jgi:hypothetical protein